MSATGDKFREYAASDREQADIVDYFADLSGDSPKSDLSHADATSLRAHADGWDEFAGIADTAE